MKKFEVLLLLMFLFFFQLNAQDTTEYIVKGRKNSTEQQKKPYVLLISADGFRYDLAMRYQAKNLLGLSASGVEATSMKPSFPSLTFPNHYSIVTGLYPAHHGIVDNRFYDKIKNRFYSISNKKEVGDGSWYGGVPLWSLAEQQNMLAASFFWVGSEAEIGQKRPTRYYKYNELFSIDKKLQILRDWLSLSDESRPHFITFYLPEPDHEIHANGVYSMQAKNAVLEVDSIIGEINKIVLASGLPINTLFVSDHGFANVDTTSTLSLPSIVDTSKFLISYGSTLIQLYAKNKKDILPTYELVKKQADGYKVFLKENMPKEWHYGTADDRLDRIGDIVFLADESRIFWSKGNKVAGAHGYDNTKQEMQATFYAWGPAFRENIKINNFENIHIYPLIAQILGLKITQPIDGDLKILQSILK